MKFFDKLYIASTFVCSVFFTSMAVKITGDSPSLPVLFWVVMAIVFALQCVGGLKDVFKT